MEIGGGYLHKPQKRKKEKKVEKKEEKKKRNKQTGRPGGKKNTIHFGEHSLLLLLVIMA